jgi:hypothetical protein
MRNTAIARESLLETIEETTEEPTTTTTPGSGGHKEGGGSRAAMTTPPTKRRSAMLTLSPGERKARRSSALIKNQSFMQQQEEEGEEDEEGETEGETEDDEAARVRQRNKVLDVLNEYYATEAKSLESFAAKLPRNRRKQGKLYLTPVGGPPHRALRDLICVVSLVVCRVVSCVVLRCRASTNRKERRRRRSPSGACRRFSAWCRSNTSLFCCGRWCWSSRWLSSARIWAFSPTSCTPAPRSCFSFISSLLYYS